MSLDSLIILVGAIIAILPFLGFPITWDHPIVFILGVLVVILGIVVRRRLHQKTLPPRQGSYEEVSE